MSDYGDEEAEKYWSDARNLIDNSGHWLDYQSTIEYPKEDPPDRLVRFMPIEQYLSLLTSGRLYFPRADEYEDPGECSFPENFCDDLYQTLLNDCDEPEFSLPSEVDPASFIEECQTHLLTRITGEFLTENRRCFVSCWHAGDVETELLWRSYGGHKGVAVSCSGPLLLKQFQDTIRVSRNALSGDRGLEIFEFVHGHVSYESDQPLFDMSFDQDTGSPTVIVRLPAFRKHRYFRLDHEYRFTARLHPDDTTQYKASAALNLAECDALVSTSPLCPPWIAKSVQAITQQYYSTVKVQRLTLDWMPSE